ncbi:MopE-related protein [Polyangium sp. y55x31]|uniref:MopE-related protein n=1 Tax=Polyangium sp. y55x31 TaxID=3042688 RepID=UPI002482FB79|nr:MopE-related protein [Polyangium sp. y55x31]MDI1482800.1 MopE-related protein [Polyangium sp. y55x31]
MRRFTRASLLSLGLAISFVQASGCSGDGANNTAGTAGGGTGGQGGVAGQGGGGQGGGQGGEGGAACTDGESRACYDADPATADRGECKQGTQTCTGSVWGACTGQVLPASEACDGKDEDCNGQVDDNIADVTCGLGQCQVKVPGCVDHEVPECTPLPPATAEACDGVDDDCDGMIDEGCSCEDGDTQSCYSGGAGTQGVGICKSGTQTCVGGAWGACEGETVPGVETCNGADDDCDGKTDEDLGQLNCGAGACFVSVEACVNGAPQTCMPGNPKAETCNGVDDDCNLLIDDGLGTLSCGLGACKTTVQACIGGQPQTCMPGLGTAEVCDGVDNDCDGNTDEGNPGGGAGCTTEQPGACAQGTQVCTGGMLQCMPTVQPVAESCNGKDDDCDGQVDEQNPGGGSACNTGQLGICAAGTTACQNGAPVCNPNSQPTVETCDGLDNNCNGAVDEQNPGGGVSCQTGKSGVCASGTTACQNGQTACVQTNQPSLEICDGLDNNCNGTVDEGNPGSGGVCPTGKQGVCAVGTYQCQNGGLVCVSTTMASAETCDNKDNDCDGLVDENNPGGGMACATGQQGVCSAGTSTCSNGGIVCTPTIQPSAEICDNKDNDCDGVVDEGNPGGGSACPTGLQGLCSTGTQVCQNGTISCVPTIMPTTEVCDNKDNDCDGMIDENNAGGGGACTTGQQGVCGAGTYVCQGGTIACVATKTPSAEICDGLDNDCDGVVDEDNPGGGVACGTAYAAPCTNNKTICQNGVLVCGVTNVFEETFATATAANGYNGWAPGTEWQIGTAMSSSGHDTGYGDPSTDHTSTADNKLAGVVIGGNASTLATHPMYYLTSPIINTAGAGSIVLDFWRWLNSDYSPYMTNVIEVYNGSTWVVIWQSDTTYIKDGSWKNIVHDITTYKNADLRVRFGFSIGETSGLYDMSSWNLDDVVIRRCQ